MKHVIMINPNEVLHLSKLGGWFGKIDLKIKKRGIPIERNSRGLFVGGDWDLNCDLVKSSRWYKDLLLYIKHGHKLATPLYSGYYDWDSLFKSISNGYYQKEEDRLVEVAIGRNCDYFLVDGRHRLIISQYLKIDKIPVHVIYQHLNNK